MSAVKGYKSMLSSVLRYKDLNLTFDSVIQELIGAFEKEFPLRGVRFPNWNLDVVSRCFSEPPCEPQVEASFLHLTKKTVSF